MVSRSVQFLHHAKLQTLVCIPRSRHFTTQQLTKSVSYPHNSCNSNLIHALQEMSVHGLNMKFKDYDALLNECVNQRYLIGGQRVQVHMIKTHYLPPMYLRTRLIVFYSKCEALNDARKVFDEMPQRSVVSWTAMISGYTKSCFYSEALCLFVQMRRSGIDANGHTFATVLNACTRAFDFEYGKQIHALIAKSPFEFHTYVGSSLLDLYAKAGKIHEARIIFDGLPERDAISCTAIISGYAQLGLDKEALDLFCTLQGQGMASNYVTYATILTALSGLAAFEYGRQVHGRVLRSEYSLNTVLENSLIDMYSKCGNLAYARRIFDRIPERTVVSWNSMLGGYCKHGVAEAVVELYNKMTEENEINPDSTTLLIVLSGCSHGGMEDVGLKFFDEMAVKYGLELGIEHYGCVVDLLGRAGQLRQALQFIKELPLEPNAAIWSSLLGACRAHHNIEIGNIAGNEVLKMEPENAGNYVILCNLYASEGRWDEVRKMRELMKEKAVLKEPGKSWIEFDQTVHTFYASDQSHPRNEDVSSKLSEILNRIKAAGYTPDVSCVVFDVDEEQKEKILLGHSEKLALAFGMMNISEAKPIRIMKNLRICVDCHDFAKFVSRIYGRELLIRDKSRFHSIVNGMCSCGDYW